MKRYALLILFIGVCFFCRITSLYAEKRTNLLRFETLSTSAGLSSSSVSGICQDAQGFLWFATQGGLNRYDGRTMRVYENDPFNSNSLVHNQIQTIYTDEDGSLWIGTYGGLSHFDPIKNLFTTYRADPSKPKSLSNNIVIAIHRDVKGNLWVGTQDGLNRLDEATGTFTVYQNNPGDPSSLPHNTVRVLEVDREGNLWIGTYGGLSRYDPARDAFVNILGSSSVMTIVEDPESSGTLYLGTWGGGLCRLDTRTLKSDVYKLPDDRVYSSLLDRKGQLWIGTWGGGLILFDRETGKVQQYTSSMQHGIPHDIAYSLYEDSSGIVWVGTHGGGVAKLVDWHNRYQYFQHNPRDPASLPAGKVTFLMKDSKGRLWCGVYNQGLHRMDPGEGGFRHYRAEKGNPLALQNDIINTLYEDPEGKVWICTNEGLFRYEEASDSFSQPFRGRKDFPIQETIYYIYKQDSKGNTWFGMYLEGAYYYSPKSGTYVHFSTHAPEHFRITDNLIRVIFEDSRGNIWIGTNNGLNIYDPSAQAITRRFLSGTTDGNSISHGNIRSIAETKEGKILIATLGGGVNIYDPQNERFSYLTIQDGLLSNMVRAVLLQDALWYFPTQRGVSVYDPVTYSFTPIQESTGLLNNEMTDAQLVDSSGTLYLGTAEGITVISSVEMNIEGIPSPLVVTGITVMGESVPLTPKDPVHRLHINLPYKKNNIQVEFAVLDYADPVTNLYSVKLEGLDREWSKPSHRSFVYYSSLPPGTYHLSVKGAGSRNNWTAPATVLSIVVDPPWWRTPIAFIVYVLVFLGLFAYVFYILRKQEKDARKKIAFHEALTRELEAQVQTRTAQIEMTRKQAVDANEAKSKFMANISHEIRTPLNGIQGMVSLMEKTPLQEDQKQYLSYVKDATKNLIVLVNDVLDHERILSGHLVIEASLFSIKEIADFIRMMYSPLAKEKGLNFDVTVPNDLPEYFVGDKTRVIQIVSNLVSNAIKYTHNGSVQVEFSPAKEANRTLKIEVRDTGIGIPEDKKEAIFERFLQLYTDYSHTGKGAGLGLAIVKDLCALMGGTVYCDSTPGKGSTFTVLLPLQVGKEASPAVPEFSEKGQGIEQGGDKETECLRILIAEDEPINQLYFRKILEKAGYGVVLAGNGKEVVEMYREKSFDLVLMDLGLPVLGGVEAANQIRSYEQDIKKERVPILALTAFALPSDVEACYAAGMDDFLTKPISEETLFHKIIQWTKTAVSD